MRAVNNRWTCHWVPALSSNPTHLHLACASVLLFCFRLCFRLFLLMFVLLFLLLFLLLLSLLFLLFLVLFLLEISLALVVLLS